MGRRGPPRTPTAILKMRGTFRSDRRPGDEPAPPSGTPPCPKHVIGEAKREYRRLCRELADMGTLSRADRGVIAAAAVLWARWTDAETQLQKVGPVVKNTAGNPVPNPYVQIARQCLELLHRYWSVLGLSPSARASIRVPAPSPPADAANPKTKFFKHG